MQNKPEGASTATNDGNEPYARKGGTNPAREIPKKMRGDDKQFIDDRLTMFKKGHAMNVHRDHMDLVKKNAKDNVRLRKIP
jgi:hypothetical protein